MVPRCAFLLAVRSPRWAVWVLSGWGAKEEARVAPGLLGQRFRRMVFREALPLGGIYICGALRIGFGIPEEYFPLLKDGPVACFAQ